VYTRTVEDVARVGASDACVVLLDSALPAEVEPLLVLPASYQNYLHTQSGSFGYQLPLVVVNKQLQAMVADWSGWAPGAATAYASRIQLRAPYYHGPINGDSGSPLMLTDGTNLILLATWYTPWTGGDFVAGDALTAALAALDGTPIAPTEVDLTSYPSTAPPGP